MCRIALLIALLAATPPSMALADETESLPERAAEALAAARANVLADQEPPELDAIWFMQLLLKIRPDDELEKWVETHRPMYKGTPFYPLIDPSAPLTPLPEDLGSGMDKLRNYTLAAFGTPPERVVRDLRAFVEVDEEGYVLTHQLAVLEWAEQVGQPLPEDLMARRPDLLARISQELDADTTFSDLYAERVAFLVVFGDPSPEQLERAITKIVDSQVEPGKWKPPELIFEYDGQRAKLESIPKYWKHCSKLSMVALAGYLQSVEPSPANAEAVQWPRALGWVLVVVLLAGALFLLRRRFLQ